MRRWIASVTVVGAVLFALAGVIFATVSAPPPTERETVREVAQTLRCPSCVGESVADSGAPVSKAMVAVIAEQVAEGRTPNEIRSWFAARYGTEVLLDAPPLAGGWVLWVVPAVLVGFAVFFVMRRRQAKGVWMPLAVVALTGSLVVVWVAMTWQGNAVDRRAAGSSASASDAVDVLRHAVARDGGDAQLRLALARALDDAGQREQAEQHYAAASRLRPLDTDIAYLHATVLVRDGRLGEAEPVLDRLLTIEPRHAPALLLLGTILWEDGKPRGAELLEEFVALEPEHPATVEVRDLLEGRAQ